MRRVPWSMMQCTIVASNSNTCKDTNRCGVGGSGGGDGKEVLICVVDLTEATELQYAVNAGLGSEDGALPDADTEAQDQKFRWSMV